MDINPPSAACPAEKHSKNGTLFGVSVGPGDPELLTLKAARVLERCPVIAAPMTRGERSLALSIAEGAVDISGKTVLSLPFEMTSDPARLEENHREQATRIGAELDCGRDVAFVCLGDISVYSTFEYVAEMLRKEGRAVEVVPGVTSFCAAAAALGISLTKTMQTALHVLPGSFTDVESALALPGTKIIMKSGRQLVRVREKIEESGLPACAVTDCGLPTQRLYPRLSELPEDSGYFTTVIAGVAP